MVMFLSALDSTIITIALPTISRSLDSNEYTWIVNGYALSCSVFLLVVGQLADFFDRKATVLGCVFLFAAGSALCGAAQSMGMMISGRVIQGIGGGGIAVMAEIVCSDMVPPQDRSKYLGLLLALASLGTVVGPPIGGGIIAHTSWRWIFYINLPLAGFAFAFLVLGLERRTPGLEVSTLSLRAKLQRIDWAGNALFAGSATALLLGLLMGGTEHAWGSVNVVLPLVLGVAGLGVFRWHEGSGRAACPVMPPRLFDNRTALALHALACFVVLMLTWQSYFLPVYFQAVLRESPERSSVLLLPTVLAPLPLSVAGGVLMAVLKRVREIHMAAAAILAVGFGVFSLFDGGTALALRVVMQVVASAGVGLLMATILPALQAQLPERDVAAVTALFSFSRSLGGIWGVTIPSVIFNARVNHGLASVRDEAVRRLLEDGGAYARASASFVESLGGETREEVIGLYVDSLRVVWFVAVGFCGAAFLLACFEKRIEINSGQK